MKGEDILVDRSGRSVILRLYESLGGKASTGVKRYLSVFTLSIQSMHYFDLSCSTLPLKGVWKTNLLEDDLETIPIAKCGMETIFKITLRPFEVATYRLLLD